MDCILNLSYECPLAHYSLIGQITACVMGLFTAELFGIPIGILDIFWWLRRWSIIYRRERWKK